VHLNKKMLNITVLDSRLTDGGKVFSLMRRPRFTPPLTMKIPDTRFCWRLSQPQGHIASGRIRYIEKESNDLIGNRTRVLPAFSVVLLPITLPRALFLDYISYTNLSTSIILLVVLDIQIFWKEDGRLVPPELLYYFKISGQGRYRTWNY
jgi:hypothetical protein